VQSKSDSMAQMISDLYLYLYLVSMIHIVLNVSNVKHGLWKWNAIQAYSN
jgi:hypothetical protein